MTVLGLGNDALVFDTAVVVGPTEEQSGGRSRRSQQSYTQSIDQLSSQFNYQLVVKSYSNPFNLVNGP